MTSNNTDKPRRSPSPSEFLLYSAFSHCMLKIFENPFERLRLLYQCQSELLKAGSLSTPYHSLFDCAKRIAKTEGLFSFWKGTLPSIIRFFPTQLVNVILNSSGLPQPWFMGTAQLVISYPLDYVKTRLLCDIISEKTGKRMFNGMIDCFSQTLRIAGLRGIFQGFLVSLIATYAYRFVFQFVWEKLAFLKQEGKTKKQSEMNNFLFAWFVTVSAITVTYPFDTIRRRLIMTAIEPTKYINTIDCTMQIIKNEGLTALWNGLSVHILKTGVLAGVGVLLDNYIRPY
eukprot:TRINITY_DN4703_c0_g1_i2.p1 TRINITY_DN4703_c0_g1~~TRINITY_DN4703_c0_g1_i2.p1  ORF type:complete len:286 (+),score=41.36 TRINITY_DN4703_c0_g1_i2:41-898(+)